MAFEGLGERLQSTMDRIKGKGKVTESDVKVMMREVRLALLEADVNFKVVKQFVNDVKERALGADVMQSLTPGQQVIKIVQEELTALMGGENQKINLSQKPPTVIMMVGLQGAGKTTTAGKLALHLRKKHNKRPLLVAGDIYRPAAIDQLQTVGKQIDIPVFALGDQVKPEEIATRALEHAKEEHLDTVIIDTAGRLHIDEALMNELKNVKEISNPNEIMLVVDSMTGQDAVNVAESFNDLLDITGVTLTKLDGDTRGGAALSIRSVTEKPIKFIGVSEKLDGLEAFHPERMASRILGMGDVMSIIEKAQDNVNEADQKALEKKLKDSSFTLDDFLGQMDQVKTLGPLDDLLKMMPGANKIKGLDKMQFSGKEIDHVQAIIRSMTLDEREHPEKLNASRKKRISKGSGRSLQEINRLLKQFNDMKKMMKQMTSGKKKGKNPFGNMGLPF
ncbi:Signal recognition particle protein [Jeotgalicoccus aerolatus]|uniref:Signal recognition particle protein n=1 Tax=Jeotgalicoccus aerolatus TaxID=709510 RepID=A0A1G8W9Z4_9STAP|nr:signal recognition particle protein [Jeotgalicoccus aerolatus]MBP1951461.1 signal recognition particle subunit SRP54 [Jeotgalicoccus aerolatus]CAD2076526.1 Signal recognition particle protein [Jeotgalicoccus aerolatus]SDJ74877.1 signal recognition particle subunit FFH/SRP54 (srp54) [Jeotgalicoccus aerolatus]GGD97311.1 signal recognition particle protein [Jeotgalicoccus aerolatus]HJG32495.1 signal recognition particle protein [Jeotgalicoccus aerolatus]